MTLTVHAISAKSANSLFWVSIIKTTDNRLPGRQLKEIIHCTLVVILQLMFTK